jgi:hypothetical protein
LYATDSFLALEIVGATTTTTTTTKLATCHVLRGRKNFDLE